MDTIQRGGEGEDVPLFKNNAGTRPKRVRGLIFDMVVAFMMFIKEL